MNVCTVTGKILYANEILLNILGYSSHEYIGKQITDVSLSVFVEMDLRMCVVRGN